MGIKSTPFTNMTDKVIAKSKQLYRNIPICRITLHRFAIAIAID